MAVVEVNHKVLKDVAGNIKTYCNTQDREMKSADAEIKSMLRSDWWGLDAQEFSSKWEGVDSKDSTASKLRDSLKNFSNCLEACADVYKRAQEDSYSEANRLPKWLHW